MKMTAAKLTLAQRKLQERGFYLDGAIDGIWGPKTEKAIVAFKRSVGLRARPYIGPVTWAALVMERPAPPKSLGSIPEWLKIAYSYLGLTEISGRTHHPTILKWWKDIGLSGIKDDETPWCAGFVGGVLVEAGLPSTRSGAARSYQTWGKKLNHPAVGAVVTFWRGSRSGWKGHVAFVAGKDQHGRLMCLGGNQANQVNIKAFSRDRVLGFNWPINVPQRPNYNLPVVQSDGTVSRDEA